MAIVEALQSVQYVVNEQGQRTAVLMNIHAWDTLIQWLETVIDAKIAAQVLSDLQTRGERPQRAGWLAWDDIREEWDAEEEAARAATAL
jgi:hypothetical protein